MKRRPLPCVLLALALGISLVSCSSTLALEPVVRSYRALDFHGAYEDLQALRLEYLEKQGPLLYALDAGLLAHHSGELEASNRYLDEAERLIREAYTESVSANIASYFVNDNTKAYQGEDYEDLYLNVFKALNYVRSSDGEAALVELRRFNEKQQFLQNKYDALLKAVGDAGRQSADIELPTSVSLRFSSSALGNWLSMVISRDMGEVDQARFSAGQVRAAFAKQPFLYPFDLPDSLEADQASRKKNHHRVNVVAFTGLAPYKEEVVERFWFSHANYVKIALPRMVSRPTRVSSIDVRLNNGSAFTLQQIEDIGRIAQEAFRLNRSFIESKTVMRSFFKATGTSLIDALSHSMATNAQTREESSRIEFFGSLLSFASRIFNEASEQADVRISHFFPDRAWVGGIDLAAGIYDAHVIYRDRNGKVIGEQQLKDLVVDSGKLHLWESIFPW